ncbi:MAG: hypothetical protein HY318_04815 [Armatimonadetes bacterium]|nr:hypothetical protein [Armatimonadota bacterium]
MPRFSIHLQARPELGLFSNPQAVEILRRNLKFVVSKFDLNLCEERFETNELTVVVDSKDLRTVSKAVERLQRFADLEVWREVEVLDAGSSTESARSIWTGPASCRRLG